MRKAETIERMYLDFDGFFASVMQQAMPALRGKPVGVIPFEAAKADYTCVIACSKEAKARGCSNVMPVKEARQICPEIVLVMQRPDLYRRAHNALLNEIACEIPIEAVKSIDELTCKLDKTSIADPRALALRLKERLRKNVGEYITCSMGFAQNRLLAKIACKIDKPNGVTIWRPEDMPGPLFALPLSSIPGVGSRMERRLGTGAVASTGLVGIGTTTPQNKIDIFGGIAVGTSYAGVTAAPTNGAIIQGNVAIGTTAISAGPKVSINGSVQVAGSGSEPCNANTVGQMRYNPTGQYMEICTYP